MSLNGLDATDINEAFQSALAEGGGWFLLKYATRDEVTLLNRGSGGVVDIRDSVAQYDDQSPLYGFVHYRRRKVILKYIPDGTSRLLRARVAVHFQAITEHFTPHDTIFSFTSAKGLNDVALSSACSLHTASASIKSSSDSLRQRGLSGIAEDIGEYQPPATDVEPVADESEKGNLNGPPALHSRPERSNSLSNAKTSAAPPSIERRESTSPTRIRHIDKALPPTPNEHAEDRVTTRNALEDTFLDTRPSAEGRPSIQSTRPSVRSTHTSHESKHKVKLGPRPSMDSFAGFHTQDWSGPIRPVSTLPNGVRLAARKQAPARSQSTRASPVIPETLKDPLPSQKPTSPVESKETPPPLPAGLPKQLQPAENRSSTMTPEKRRLKKALELRQKQLAARRAQELAEAEQSQGHPVQPSCDLGKRESLTATLPDLSPADDSTTDVLQERIEALDRNPDLVHVGPQNVDKGVSENFEVSPISLLEASDGPSTQASSVSDEEETPCNTDPTAPNEVISGSPVDASTHDQSISGTGTLLEPEHPLPDGRGDTLEPSGPDECKTERSISNMTAANQSDNHKEDALFSTAPRGSPDSSESKTSVQETADKVPLIGELSDSLDTRVSKPPRISSDRLIPHEIPLPLSDEEELGTSPEKKAIAEPLISNPHNEEVTRQHLAPDQTQEGNGGLRDSRSSIDDIPKEQCERRARRHGLVSPIKRVSSPDYSDEQFLSDDSFMEELKSATVQEAKPISVSKSPIMPVFPRSVSDSKSTEEPRPASASSDLKRPKRRNDPPMMPKLPDLYSARSSSAPYAPLHEAQLSSPTLKKVGVSSGISQRIKLLEQLSSRPTSPSSQLSSPSTALGSSPAFPSTRKTSFRASQAAAEIARSSTHNSKSRPQLTHLSKSRSPDRNSNRMTDGVFRIDVATKSGKARPESISVTARIVRGSHNRISEVPEGVSRPRTSDLYPSPLTVEHQPTRPTSPPLSPLKPPNPRYARSMSSTSTAPKSDVARRDSISSRLSSTPSRRGSESELPRSMSDLSVNSMSNLDGSKDDKKESRKSRLFKRMSNISAASRRSIASALSPVRKDIKEEAIVEHHEPSRETIKPLAVEVGEVNIQFPDTLLWKRRHMKIEDEGILVLSASKSDNNLKIISKRYRLTEFHAPYLPDQDQQELPNSVVLDFRDGSTLQCACENAYAQTEVLQALKRAHRTSNPAR
ncbi:MAG: hypothetical protein LQ349_002067 [Xanthoria aureola]|nr:MAG: hypothetical protein LQ349_002067 [Xanthoria aureola]